jgi:hypothetical protein
MFAILLVLAAGAAADARLVCNRDEKLVVVAPDTGASNLVAQQPPAASVALGAAGETLVSVSSSGAVSQLRDGQWSEVTRLGDNRVQKRPLRIDSRYPQWATIWLRGHDPGTIPGAVGVSAKGEVRKYNSADSHKMGEPFRAAPRALGQAEPDVPPGLIASPKAGAPNGLVFNEPSPWGGRLVAPAGAPEGDFPTGPLVHVGADGKAHKLDFEGHEIDFKGAVAYGPRQLLLIDGAAAGIGRRALLASPDGRVRAIPGVQPPCAWWPAPAAGPDAPR